MRLRLLCLLTLPSYAASSQTTPAKPAPPVATVCMPAPQAAKVRDSLRVLPKVRREARSWRTAATAYRAAADTARTAYYREATASANLHLALREETVEAARYEGKAKEWKEKARRRGFWNWVAAAAVVLLTVITINQ